MFNPKRALLYAFLIAVLLEPISGRRGFSGGHSYPKSGGLSGGGHRTGGLSGGGSGHGYPSSGGHGYPSSGGHGYPSSGGHGYPSSGGTHGYPAGGGLSGGGSSYPSNGAKPGYPSGGSSHGYPSSGGGLSGHGQNKPTVHHTTNIHNYNYAPPQQISYSPVRGGPPQHYPVFHGTPPTYVYQYKNSGSKYGTLLAGLALLNLGTLGVAAYAASGHSAGKTQYTPQPGEVCKFAVKKDNGDYEETKIDCQIISSFILQDQAQVRPPGTNTQTSMVTTVTNTTIMNATTMAEHPSTPGPAPPAIGNVLYAMLPNGTLVPVNSTVPGVPVLPGSPINATQNVTGPLAQNGVVSSSVVTTTTTNTTLVNALDVKGKAVEVTPGMQCFLIRNSSTHNMRKSVPCGLLQTYADKSIQRKNSAARNVPMFTIVAAILAFCVAY